MRHEEALKRLKEVEEEMIKEKIVYKPIISPLNKDDFDKFIARIYKFGYSPNLELKFSSDNEFCIVYIALYKEYVFHEYLKRIT